MPKSMGNYGKSSQPAKRVTSDAKIMKGIMEKKPVGKMGGMK